LAELGLCEGDGMHTAGEIADPYPAGVTRTSIRIPLPGSGMGNNLWETGRYSLSTSFVRFVGKEIELAFPSWGSVGS